MLFTQEESTVEARTCGERCRTSKEHVVSRESIVESVLVVVASGGSTSGQVRGFRSRLHIF
jgi:hypothetical protein